LSPTGERFNKSSGINMTLIKNVAYIASSLFLNNFHFQEELCPAGNILGINVLAAFGNSQIFLSLFFSFLLEFLVASAYSGCLPKLMQFDLLKFS
jgi:hypothetical protein